MQVKIQYSKLQETYHLIGRSKGGSGGGNEGADDGRELHVEIEIRRIN